MIRYCSIFLLSILYFPFINAYAGYGDTLHVVPHNKTLMQTDPKRGVNEVLKWAVFPSEKTPYRKITAYITMQCPEGMKCGAWDYIDEVIIRRKGGINQPSKDLEILRVLTPYGGWFDNQWRFTWKQDVTDWGILLRDSVEIEYQHTGYESNDGLGWLVTVDFEIVVGTPVMQPVDFQPLWSQSFAYGDSAKPFETILTPKTLTSPPEARFINYRIIQTGHGMDRPDNCSEFCDKWRDVYFDGQKIDHKQMYIVCGNNPVFPQAGTWVYSRGNWCPGSLSIPDIYTLPIDKEQHRFDLKMEPYRSENPQGGWLISANAFYYKSPTAKNDVAVEQILTPSVYDEQSRMNPVCASPRILIKNNGANTLTSVVIEYGIKGAKKNVYTWKGQLPFLQIQEIELPGTLSFSQNEQIFEIKLLKPNGKKDEYENDNYMSSVAVKPPVYYQQMVLALMTNRDSTQTSWKILDAKGKVVTERKAGNLMASTLYADTLRLPEGCYQLQIFDSDNDGLNFWANPQGGYGYIRLFDNNNRLIKNFDPNFGTSIVHYFSVESNAPLLSSETVFEFFPARTRSTTMADIVIDRPQTIVLRFIDEKGVVQWENTMHHFQSQMLKLDLSHLPPSFYQVEMVLENGTTITKNIRKVVGK